MPRKDEIVRIKVPPNTPISVEEIKSQDVPTLDLICGKKYTYDGYIDDCDLYLFISSIGPLSSKSYILSKSTKAADGPLKPVDFQSPNSKHSVSYHKISDSKLFVKHQRCSDSECDSIGFNVEYTYYDSYEGEGQKSGLYIFRDADAGAGSKPYNKVNDQLVIGYIGRAVSVLEIPGDTVDSRIVFNHFGELQTATVTSRIKGIEGEHGKEVAVNFSTDGLDTDRFYTDSNGMVMEERILNNRKSYPLTNLTGFEIVSNFYPVNTAITLREKSSASFGETRQFTVLNDRAQSGSSLGPGEVELLIDRRTYFDDDRGVEEPLNETVNGKPIIVETYHHIISSRISELQHSDYMETKRLQRSLFEEPLQTLFSVFSDENASEILKLSKHETQETLKYIGSLPPSIKIVTKPLDRKRVAVRLYNMNEAFDGFSDPIDVDLSGIIADVAELREESGHNVAFKITEWNLTLNQQIGEMKQVNWVFKNGKAIYSGLKDTVKAENVIHLRNQEMRSFIIEFEHNDVVTSVE